MPCMVDLNSLVLLNSLEREGGVGGGGGESEPEKLPNVLWHCVWGSGFQVNFKFLVQSKLI